MSSVGAWAPPATSSTVWSVASASTIMIATPLATEERAGDLPRGVLPLFDVDGQGKEVELVLRVLRRRRCRQDHRVAVEVGDRGARGLLGESPSLEADRALAERALQDCFGV